MISKLFSAMLNGERVLFYDANDEEQRGSRGKEDGGRGLESAKACINEYNFVFWHLEG